MLYAAADLATAAYETLIRDRLDINPLRTLTPADYQARVAVNVSTAAGRSIHLLDLTRGNAARYGVPSDVTRHSQHAAGQHFATFVHSNLPWVDGLLYRSRFTDQDSLAIFDRALVSMTPGPVMPLSRHLVATALGSWNISVT